MDFFLWLPVLFVVALLLPSVWKAAKTFFINLVWRSALVLSLFLGVRRYIICPTCALWNHMDFTIIADSFDAVASFNPSACWIAIFGTFLAVVIGLFWYEHRGTQGSSKIIEAKPNVDASISTAASLMNAQNSLSPQVEQTLQRVTILLEELLQLTREQVVGRSGQAAVCLTLEDVRQSIEAEGLSTRKLLRDQVQQMNRISHVTPQVSNRALVPNEDQCTLRAQVEANSHPESDVDVPSAVVNVAVAPTMPKRTKKQASKRTNPRSSDARPSQPAKQDRSSSSAGGNPADDGNLTNDDSEMTVLPLDRPDALTSADLQRFVGMSPSELARAINADVAKNRQSAKKPPHLSDEEKAVARLSLAELDILWKEQTDRAVVPLDSEPIGILTEEELGFSRQTIRDIIRQRRAENHVRRLAERGIECHVCPRCHRTVGANHECWGTNWTTPVRKGNIPRFNQTVISQEGRGDVRIQQRRFVDAERANKQFQELKEMKHLIDSQHERLLNLFGPDSSLTGSVPSPQAGLTQPATTSTNPDGQHFLSRTPVPASAE